MGPSTAEQPFAEQLPLISDAAANPGAETVLRRLSACLGHHVNNALTGVIGYLGLTLRDAPSKGHLHDHLQAGLTCAYQAAETVKRLAAFATPNAPSGERQLVSLRRLAEESIQEIPSLRRARLKVEVQADADGLVLGDHDLLRMALGHVVRNAVEAMPLEGTLSVRVEEVSGRVEFLVRDTGPGFTAEAAAHLFDPFWTTKSNGHLGLGLILCRDTIQAHGGTLSIASGRGAGTTVTASLPAAPAIPRRSDEVAPPTVLAPSSGVLQLVRA